MGEVGQLQEMARGPAPARLRRLDSLQLARRGAKAAHAPRLGASTSLRSLAAAAGAHVARPAPRGLRISYGPKPRRASPNLCSAPGMGEVGQLQDGEVSSAGGERHARGVYLLDAERASRTSRVVRTSNAFHAGLRVLSTPDLVCPSLRTSCAFHSGPRVPSTPDFMRISLRTSRDSAGPRVLSTPDFMCISLRTSRVSAGLQALFTPDLVWLSLPARQRRIACSRARISLSFARSPDAAAAFIRPPSACVRSGVRASARSNAARASFG